MNIKMLSTDKSGHERGMKSLTEYYVKTRKSRRVEGSVGTEQNRTEQSRTEVTEQMIKLKNHGV